jgi:hypothetical protein
MLLDYRHPPRYSVRCVAARLQTNVSAPALRADCHALTLPLLWQQPGALLPMSALLRFGGVAPYWKQLRDHLFAGRERH